MPTYRHQSPVINNKIAGVGICVGTEWCVSKNNSIYNTLQNICTTAPGDLKAAMIESVA
jgi:hypothetical protein